GQMSANSVDILIAGKETVGVASDSAVSGLQRINDALHHTEGRLKSFNSIMELALGFHVGRFFFEKVHEALVKIGEGFIEASAHGESFSNSLGQGLKNMLGLETSAQQLAKAMKANAEFSKEFAKGTQQGFRNARDIAGKQLQEESQES